MQPAEIAPDADPYDGHAVYCLLRPFGTEEMELAEMGESSRFQDDDRHDDSEGEGSPPPRVDVFDLKPGQLEEVIGAIRRVSERHWAYRRDAEWCPGPCHYSDAAQARWTLLRLFLVDAALHEGLDDAERFARECERLGAHRWGTESLVLRVRELAADPARLARAFSDLFFEPAGWLGPVVRIALNLGKYHLAGRLLGLPAVRGFLQTEEAGVVRELIIEGLVVMLQQVGEAPGELELCRARLLHALQSAPWCLVEPLAEWLAERSATIPLRAEVAAVFLEYATARRNGAGGPGLPGVFGG